MTDGTGAKTGSSRGGSRGGSVALHSAGPPCRGDCDAPCAAVVRPGAGPAGACPCPGRAAPGSDRRRTAAAGPGG
ncbi:hypothetical protein G6F31_020824 [Rhizopus arrhizus]|nr:hypothetical protein G6F31_020824 [Rhizopus arrhizus]